MSSRLRAAFTYVVQHPRVDLKVAGVFVTFLFAHSLISGQAEHLVLDAIGVLSVALSGKQKP